MVGLWAGVEAKLAATPAPEGEKQGTDPASASAQEDLQAEPDMERAGKYDDDALCDGIAPGPAIDR